MVLSLSLKVLKTDTWVSRCCVIHLLQPQTLFLGAGFGGPQGFGGSFLPQGFGGSSFLLHLDLGGHFSSFGGSQSSGSALRGLQQSGLGQSLPQDMVLGRF